MKRIGEEIRVAVIFGPGSRVEPVWFDWRRRKHEVKEITYTWREKRGDCTVLHFAVSDGADLYELCYNSGNHVWGLKTFDG